MSSEKKFEISATETDRRIARKICRREFVFKFFENLKTMKAKMTFFNSNKSDLDINNDDERLFDLIFV